MAELTCSREPLVSCILVAGGDRRAVSLAIRCFERQEYEPREMIVLDDGQAALAAMVPASPRIRHFQLGPKLDAAAMRDFGCREARGDVIAHWSDRAWYGPHYLLCLLNALLRDGADVCGLNPALFCDAAAGRAWRFTSGGARQVFASGSVCYRRDFWQAHPLVSAEGPDGLVQPPHGGITALSGPACQVSFAPPPAAAGARRLKSCALAGIRRVLGRDWHSYAGSEEGAASPAADLVIDRPPAATPLVSCLMLARDPRFVSAAVNWFLLQNYEPKELLVVEAGAQAEHLAGQDARLRYIRPGPGVSAGAARNLACEQARGELIVHWDDCDWQAPVRLPRTVQALLGGDADVCVSNPALCYGLEAGQASLFDCPPEARYWAAPGSLSYRRAFWAANRFPDTDLREDLRFVWNAPAARVVSLPESSCRVSMRADRFEGAYWHPHPVEDVRHLLGEDWNFLETEVVAPEPPARAEAVAAPPPLVSCIMTAGGDPRSAALAVEYFLRQDYAPSELIVVDDGAEPLAASLPQDRRIRYFRIASPMTAVAKRSLACQHARGEFILRWESGWWYAADRIRRMVEPLLAAQAGIGGLHTVLLYDVTSGAASQWRSDGRPHASSLCYRRSLPQAQFPELVAGEGLVAIPHSPGARFLPLADPTCQVLIQRDRGRVPAFLEGAYREPYPAQDVRAMMGDDWQFYEAEIEAPVAPARAVAPAARARRRALPAQPARSAAGDPRVTCIMPTYNRRRFVPLAIEYFLRQDYEPKELIVVDDGSDPVEDMVPADGRFRYIRVPGRLTVGAKRNLACAEARGEIILHWDDDEWYAPRRIRTQVRHLLREGADLCGLNPTLFYDLGTSLAWLYRYPAEERFWVAGTSFCYRREFWERKPFAEVDVGEDNRFLWEAPPARMSTLPDSSCVVAMIHDGNVSPKSPGGGYWEPFDAAEMRRILGEDSAVYERAAAIAAAAPRPLAEPARSVESRAEAGGERPRLSILICSLFDRASYLSALMESLARQARKDVEVLVEIDDGRKTIGAKRNSLLDRATGRYVCFIDDDDTVSPDYIEEIFKGIDRDVDHVGLRQIATTNGQNPRECRSSAHYSWEERDGITWRGVLHLNPLKREIAQQVRYPEISFGEDFHWGTAVAQLGAIRTEYLVEKPVYFYDYREPKNTPVRPLKLLLKFPSRNRPQALRECLDSVIANLHDPGARMLVSLDEDDPQAAAYREMLNSYSLTVRWGRSRNKIHAVNRDIPEDDWDILVVISDDMRVVAPAFDLQIAADMRESFSGTDGFLHYDDGFVGERLATIPVLGREYYERFGFVYHPDYRALWCDNEQMEAARLLEKYRYIPKVLIEHRHAGNVGAALDILYQANERFFEQDKSTFLARQSHRFFLFP